MNKLVYLEELDSVRNTPEEIKIGQKALYEEIVINGNKVVLSFNQVLDSRAFLCAIENERQYEHIIELFQRGYLRFSSYSYPGADGKTVIISSASQYIQNAINKALEQEQKNTYIFSGLPIISDEKELLSLINEAIKYSSPSILERYSNYENDKERLDYLQRYVKTVLQLSVERLANNPVKTTGKIQLVGFIQKIQQMPLDTYFARNPALLKLLKEAFVCLDTVRKTIERPNERSNWHKQFKKMDTEASYMAEAIVNIAYNYTVEDSIAGISKHYDDTDDNDFYLDFQFRLEKYWKECKEEIHILHAPEKTAHELYKDWKGMPHWATATRLVADEKILKKLNKSKESSEVKAYETNYHAEKTKWGVKTVFTLCLQFFIAIAIAFVIHGFNEASGAVESVVGDWLSGFGLEGDNLTIFVSNFLIYTVGFGTIWSLLQMILNLPDIAENLKKLCLSIFDGVVVIFTPRKIAYKRLKQENENE